jgi:YVTN family beta-propeller protein
MKSIFAAKHKTTLFLLGVLLGTIFPVMADPAAPMSARLSPGELLPTGQRITPEASAGSTFQLLNPDLPGYPEVTAGQAVSTSVSADGNTLLILTSGYNRLFGPDGQAIPEASTEYVFIYDISGEAPAKKQVIQVPNTYSGMAWNPNGLEFYVSGGRDDNVHVYGKGETQWTEKATIALGHTAGLNDVLPIAAGLAVTADGRRLLVANLQNDSASWIDLETHAVTDIDLRPGKVNPADAGKPGGEYPFWVAIKGNERAYVTSQRDREVVVLDVSGSRPSVVGRIAVGGQPNKMVFNRSQTRLFVANGNSDSVSVIDTATDRVIETISVTAPKILLPKADRLRGANPNSLALTPDERLLLVTNGGMNAVAVIHLGHAASDRHDGGDKPRIARKSKPIGLIPTGWYPNSVSTHKDGSRLYVVNGKSNTGPNPGACRNTASIAPGSLNACRANNQYVWQLTKAGFLTLPFPHAGELIRLTWQVAHNNGFSVEDRLQTWKNTVAFLRGRIKHVIYIVKENRTYDQVMGNLETGNGDPNLAILAPYSPNHQSLARRFVNLDNFYDSGEVSGDGWNWSTAARTTDYTEKSVPVNYADRGLTYDWEGANRDINVSLPTLEERLRYQPELPLDPDLLAGTADVAAPDAPEEAGAGYLWDGALRAGLSIRNYGFFVGNLNEVTAFPHAAGLEQAVPLKQALAPYTDRYFRGYDQTNADFYLFKEWEREFDEYVKHGNLPNLSFVRLPHDHFGSFTTAQFGVNTVETQMADNDYATGLVVEKVARSPYKHDTLIFVVEDDAQNGGDHVDAHRSIAYVAGPYVKQGALVSNHYTTVSMIRTIEEILGIKPTGLTDGLAAPMAEVFDQKQKDWDYQAIVPQVLYTTQLPLPPQQTASVIPPCGVAPKRTAGYWAAAMKSQDFSVEDRLDEPRFNRALWSGLKGESVPYPEIRGGQDLREGRASLLKTHLQTARAECAGGTLASSR